MSLISFEKLFNKDELKILSKLNSPAKIQEFVDEIPYSTDKFYRCPHTVLRDRKAHCFDGAMFAAAAFRMNGYPPLVLDMLPNDRDDDHILALYKKNNHWGAVAKSNFVGLRFREPIYRNLRELVLSYFDDYYNLNGEKTLRGYTNPLNLSAFDNQQWMTRDEAMEAIAERMDRLRKFNLLTEEMVAGLSLKDKRSLEAGMHGTNSEGLFKPT